MVITLVTYIHINIIQLTTQFEFDTCVKYINIQRKCKTFHTLRNYTSLQHFMYHLSYFLYKGNMKHMKSIICTYSLENVYKIVTWSCDCQIAPSDHNIKMCNFIKGNAFVFYLVKVLCLSTCQKENQ